MRTLTSLVLALLLAGCATAQRSGAAVPQASTVPVRFENHSSCDVRVSVTQNGMRLGTWRLIALETMTRRVAPNGSADPLVVLVEPFACETQPYTVGRISPMASGAVVKLESRPELSTMTLVGPKPML